MPEAKSSITWQDRDTVLAGTDFGPDDTFLTAGGRVLDVVATGPTIADARSRAYEAAARIEWPGVQYRRDIAAQAS